MVTALDVAGFVYKRMGWVDAWKLEKLTYFAQAWHLAWDGRALFKDDFEAWQDGPVVPKVHRVNKYDRPREFGIYGTVLPGANPEALSAESQRIVEAVLEFYGSMETQDLIELTHMHSPWIKARGELGKHAMSSETLSIAEMRRCYTAKAMTGGDDVPPPPSLAPVPVAGGDLYQSAVDSEIERWSDTLALLAER